MDINTTSNTTSKMSDSKMSDSVTITIPQKENQVAKPNNRCHECNRKLDALSLYIGNCRCNGVYCSKHKTPYDHNCPYDYKSIGDNPTAKNTGSSYDSGISGCVF